jgi:hypothetical protein
MNEDLTFRLRQRLAGDIFDGTEAHAIINDLVDAVRDAHNDPVRRSPTRRQDSHSLSHCRVRAHQCDHRSFWGWVMLVLGINPGIRGGLAVINDVNGVATLRDAIDIPTIGTAAKERVDVIAMRDWIQPHLPASGLIERAQAMRRQGASSSFKYGRAIGALEATVTLCAISLEIIEPVTRKRFWKLPPKDKECSRQRALELFPSAHDLLARKRDHGRAETALIALYGNRSSRRDRGVINSGQAGIPGNLGCNTVKGNSNEE